jgi:hypothetical protein
LKVLCSVPLDIFEDKMKTKSKDNSTFKYNIDSFEKAIGIKKENIADSLFSSADDLNIP